MKLAITDNVSAHIAINSLVPQLVSCDKNTEKEKYDTIHNFIAQLIVANYVTVEDIKVILTHYSIIHTFTSVSRDFLQNLDGFSVGDHKIDFGTEPEPTPKPKKKASKKRGGGKAPVDTAAE